MPNPVKGFFEITPSAQRVVPKDIVENTEKKIASIFSDNSNRFNMLDVTFTYGGSRAGELVSNPLLGVRGAIVDYTQVPESSGLRTEQGTHAAYRIGNNDNKLLDALEVSASTRARGTHGVIAMGASFFEEAEKGRGVTASFQLLDTFVHEVRTLCFWKIWT